MKIMNVYREKTHQTFLGTKRSLVGFFFAKWSTHGEEPEQQKTMKRKKKWKNSCRKKSMELFLVPRKACWVCLL
jgi:hypothetical protein